MKRFYIHLALSGILLSSAAAQQVIFNDDFSTAPALNGWTQSVVTTGTASGSITSNGNQAIIGKDGGPSGTRAEGRITRTISTLGFENIALQLTAFQTGTQFEGGNYLATNTDSLSVYIDTGSGFVPLFQRTGEWGPVTPGFTDGGDGSVTVPTSSGTVMLNPGAANNGSLRIQIEGIVWAGPEDYLLDFFSLTGTILTAAPIVIADNTAIASFHRRGVPFAAALGEANRQTFQAAGRDVNERLFRLRSGFADPEDDRDWIGFAVGDFGSANLDAESTVSDLENDIYAGTVGFEYRGATNWAAGFAWTYLESDQSFSSVKGSGEGEGHVLSTYFSVEPVEGAFLSVLYAYGELDNDYRRDTGLGMAFSDPGSQSHCVSVDGGYHFTGNLGSTPVKTGPIFGLDFLDGKLDSFLESGPSRAGLSVDEQDFESLLTRLGWQISAFHEIGRWDLMPQFRVSWERENFSQDGSAFARLSQSPFTAINGATLPTTPVADLSGPDLETDYLNLGAALKVSQGKAASVTLDYEAHLFRENVQAHFLGFRYRAPF